MVCACCRIKLCACVGDVYVCVGVCRWGVCMFACVCFMSESIKSNNGCKPPLYIAECKTNVKTYYFLLRLTLRR